MVKILKFENRTSHDVQVCIEPLLDYIDFPVEKVMNIEFIIVNEKFDEPPDIVLTDDSMIIYESRQYSMNIFIDGELKYSSFEK
jgi:hypothetical protein